MKIIFKGFKKVEIISIFLVILISVFIVGFTVWMTSTFGHVDFEQYLFSITSPTSGTPMSFYIKIALAILTIVILSILLTFGILIVLNKVKARRTLSGKSPLGLVWMYVLCGLILIGSSLVYLDYNLKISTYLTTPSGPYIESNYVKPRSSIVKFPKKKKNLIYIYLESFEATYFSKEMGGNVDRNLIPGLTNLIQEPSSVSFSNSDKYGGGLQAPSTGYSIAGMFAQQSGLPFKVPVSGNDYGKQGKFAPGAITLGDILEHEGYNNRMIVGADGVFAGVTNFYQTHGNYQVLDLIAARNQGLIPQDYYEWWGFEDKKLFEYGVQALEELSKDSKPFSLILEADDSHFPDGYTDASCSNESSKPYENSISCVDAMVSEFIEYVKKQDYYKDTVIVVHGDHLSMEKDYFKTLDSDYTRTTFNAYLNVSESLIKQSNLKNRQFSSMDVFPTILEAMDVEIKGHRLGLGTSLFSREQTRYESEGVENVNEALKGPSDWFNESILIKENKYE